MGCLNIKYNSKNYFALFASVLSPQAGTGAGVTTAGATYGVFCTLAPNDAPQLFAVSLLAITPPNSCACAPYQLAFNTP